MKTCGTCVHYLQFKDEDVGDCFVTTVNLGSQSYHKDAFAEMCPEWASAENAAARPKEGERNP